MAVALYRRYRPENFDELIGQSQVTDPLRSALRNDRANHAYLFSGPRGCGKTTSARILARCLNCAEGPTDTPCGVCDSCVELSRDGTGSLDVIEIDAASHNGVDDARDLRERAAFAPARDRYKIYILDEAHMVTSQGFNALLKIVEEPPAHVKFIFATTEPDKVIGTIRSRTHHYPFRLVPPAVMLDYVTELCEQEGVTVETGVLPTVIRAGGGSVRDTLSLLDQIIAGSDDNTVTRERTNNLLGYTPSELLDEGLESIARGDSANAFSVIDRVIHTGNDPRRFVEDVLERLRDLVIVDATGPGAKAVLRGVPADELERMTALAALFGGDALSRAADIVNSALTGMTGTTPPRIHLELMVARLLVGAPDVAPAQPLRAVAAGTSTAPRSNVSVAAPAAPQESPHATASAVPAEAPAAPPAAVVTPAAVPVSDSAPDSAPAPTASSPAPDDLTLADVNDIWPDVLDELKAHQSVWVIVNNARPVSFEANVLTLEFVSQVFLESFKKKNDKGVAPFEVLRELLADALGVTVNYKAHVGFGATISGTARAPMPGSAAEPPTVKMPPVVSAPSTPAVSGSPLPSVMPEEFMARRSSPAPQNHVDRGAPAQGTRTEPTSTPETEVPLDVAEPTNSLDSDANTHASAATSRAEAGTADSVAPATAPTERRGESVVREILGATLIATETKGDDAAATTVAETDTSAPMFDLPDAE
mgnify:CR=1 FL=1